MLCIHVISIFYSLLYGALRMVPLIQRLIRPTLLLLLFIICQLYTMAISTAHKNTCLQNISLAPPCDYKVPMQHFTVTILSISLCWMRVGTKFCFSYENQCSDNIYFFQYFIDINIYSLAKGNSWNDGQFFSIAV